MIDVETNSFHAVVFDERKDEVDLTRRAILMGGAGLLVGGLLGCGAVTRRESGNRNIGIDGRDYSIPEPTETAREILIEARSAEIEIAPNKIVNAWTYDGKLPGTEIRVKEGERIRITVRNKLPEETTVHWHGQFQRGTNKMDGVPGVTQDPIPTYSDFVYDFHAEPAGSFFYHSHKGLQIERGLGGTLIVEPMREPLAYDRDYTVVLDDWLESTPEEALSKLKQSGGGMMGGRRGSNMQMGTGSEVDYQAFLINGRAPESPFEFLTKRGEKVRLRVINPSGSTIYRFAIAGHKLTVTHADSLPVKPVEVDTFEIAPGERYDVLVNADNPGIWAIAAIPADGVSNGTGRALLRYSDAQATSAPIATQSPMELNARMLSYNQLIALEPRMQPDAHKRRIDIALSGGMMSYEWTINGQAYPNAKPFEIRAGELIRLTMTNHSMMRHPMHLHGHSFRLLQKNAGDAAPLKDTVIVNHMESVEVEFLADNPGDWAFHCHNAYHMDTGMMRVFKYV
ncbi:MAG: multicopper oxidase family protein [Pyrinomonadaceae bacterium]